MCLQTLEYPSVTLPRPFAAKPLVISDAEDRIVMIGAVRASATGIYEAVAIMSMSAAMPARTVLPIPMRNSF